MKTKVVKSIMECVGFSIGKWKQLFERYEEGGSVSISTISCWRQGKQCMGVHYRNIFICILCEQEELKPYEEEIRHCVMSDLKIAMYLDSYWTLKDMEYKNFLEYILYKLRVDDIRYDEYNWENISVSVLLKLCVDKAKRIKQKINIKENGEELQLEYVHDENQKYNVYVGFCIQSEGDGNIQKKCDELECTNNGVLRYLVVAQDVSDELYRQMLEKHHVYLLKVDFYDINQVEVVNNFIANIYPVQDEKTLYFMNALADVVLDKIFKMNYIVLKEILSQNYNYKKVNEHFFESNAGLWMYQYPMRRALAFEEKRIN